MQKERTKQAFNIRALVETDLPGVKGVIDANELFPSEMIDDMTAGYFTGTSGPEFWLTCEEVEPVAVAYYVPERMTQGTWNLLLIAVHPDRHGQGIGAAIMDHVERHLSDRGERILLVETSGLPQFERTRQFYRMLGYDVEATIREFYNTGEDKVVFRKVLQPA